MAKEHRWFIDDVPMKNLNFCGYFRYDWWQRRVLKNGLNSKPQIWPAAVWLTLAGGEHQTGRRWIMAEVQPPKPGIKWQIIVGLDMLWRLWSCLTHVWHHKNLGCLTQLWPLTIHKSACKHGSRLEISRSWTPWSQWGEPTDGFRWYIAWKPLTSPVVCIH